MDLDLEINEDDILLEDELNEELEYNDFYKTNVKFIKLFFFYLDKNRNIIKIQKEKKYIKDNKIFKNDLIKIIDTKKKFLNKKFVIRDILKYNFNLDIENIYDFANTSSEYNFLQTLKDINDIYWDKTIEKFNSINSLYFIFADNYTSNNKTKKIFFQKKRRKTSKRKLLKKTLPTSNNDIIKLK
tara:strand:- start:998 stop:1552 length:555 start_codon:yes stop_codon:yes gene_type:complete